MKFISQVKKPFATRFKLIYDEKVIFHGHSLQVIFWAILG